MAIKNKKKKATLAEKGSIISFSDDDYLEGFDHNHDDLMVIMTIVDNYTVKRILVNQGSLVDIPYSVTVAIKNIQRRDPKPYP